MSLRVPPLTTDLTEPLVTTVQALLEREWLPANTGGFGPLTGKEHERVYVVKEDQEPSGSHYVRVSKAFIVNVQITTGIKPYWQCRGFVTIEVGSTKTAMWHKIEREVNRILCEKGHFNPLNSQSAASGIKNISPPDFQSAPNLGEFKSKYWISAARVACMFFQLLV